MNKSVPPQPPLRHLREARAGRRQGMMLLLTTFALICLTLLGLALYSLSITSSRLADSGYQKVQATALADAGVEALYAQVASTVPGGTSASPVWATTAIGSTALTSPLTGRSNGTFSAQMAAASPSYSGGLYTFQVQGAGVAPNGTTRSQVTALFATTGTHFTFPNGAIISNGPVTFGNSHTGTSDLSGAHQGNVYANGDIIVHKNNTVDGAVTAAPGYSVTGAAYVSQGVTAPTVTPFPTAAQLQQWQASWLNTAKTGTTYPSNAVPAVITAPAYISGSLTSNVTIIPTSGARSVVYIAGTISGDIKADSDGITTDTVTIICTGPLTSQTVSSLNGPSGCTLVTLAAQSDAIALTNHSSMTGTFYAAYGGATIRNPGMVFDGTLIAGGTDPALGGTGSVTFGNGGGNAVVTFPGGNFDSSSGALPPSFSSLSVRTQSL